MNALTHQRLARSRPLVGVALAIVLDAGIMRMRGCRIGRNTVVRCRAGHLFTTIWLPGASLKAIRLGWWRFQRCPVGEHWAWVTPVKESDLSAEQKRFATQHKDIRIP